MPVLTPTSPKETTTTANINVVEDQTSAEPAGLFILTCYQPLSSAAGLGQVYRDRLVTRQATSPFLR